MNRRISKQAYGNFNWVFLSHWYNLFNYLHYYIYLSLSKKQTTTFQELQNRALRKITFKKRHDRISCVYKECKILKFPDILNLQNCLFMYQIQHSPKFSASFPTLYAKDKHNYDNRSAKYNLLDIPLTKTSMCGKISMKNHCIRDWNNLIFPILNFLSQR